ncbi:MAG TPA: precorrin-6y C5,15-methyltransferase (decarboxylating) subunit CbiE [Syntrophomonadaceae bacterium]|nr:precorrin-6y C5,15-methyltransferase (decarboxylating) subunit CbiE [Syntrophomonadaceae bacterium]
MSVMVVGVGPGNPAYCTPAAWKEIQNAELLVGAKRLLQDFARDDQKQLPIGKDLQGLLQQVEQRRHQERIVVMVSGDTGLYSLASYLARNMNADDLIFIPGISSVQYLFAQLKRSWQGVQILSVHGRFPFHLAELVKGGRVTALLTGYPWSPARIAGCLLEDGVGNLPVVLGVALSYPDEQLIHTNLQLLSTDHNQYENTVMVIFNE